MTIKHDIFLISQSQADGGDKLSHIKVDDSGVPIQLQSAVAATYPGSRKLRKLAQPDGPNVSRGAGFTILPDRPDPDMSQMSCFLINPRNLRDVNPWNATEWSQAEDGNDDGLELENAPEFAAASFELLIAGPAGRVYFVRRSDAGFSIDEISENMLSAESELWVQLRNGLVAGSVRYIGHPDEPGRVVPLFNLTSVMPRRVAGA